MSANSRTVSRSMTAASTMAWCVGSGRRSGTGIALERIAVVAQSHWQKIPDPVQRLGAPDPGEALVAALLSLGPWQLEQDAGPRWQPTGGQEGGDRVEDGCDDAPECGPHRPGARKALGDVADPVLGGRVRDDDLVHHPVPVFLKIGVIRRHRAVADPVAPVPRLGFEVDLFLLG